MDQDSHKVLSLLSLNAYMIPGIFSKKVHQTCERQDVRASQIGDFAKDKDLIVLQEMWGSQVYPLQAHIENTHVILDENKSWAPLGAWSGSVIDSVRFYVSKNGGLWFACRKNISIVYSLKHQFSVSESSSGKGAQLLVLDMSQYWGPETWLILCNTHLDPTDKENQKQQMKEIYSFIGTVLTTLPNNIPNFSTMKSGLIICGDFNISSTEEMYKTDIPEIFRNCSVDLYQEYITQTGGKEDFTYEGYNSLSAGGGRGNYQVRIDYVFRLDKYIYNTDESGERDQEKKATETTLTFRKVVAKEATINKQPVGKEFSDHWTLVFKIFLSE